LRDYGKAIPLGTKENPDRTGTIPELDLPISAADPELLEIVEFPPPAF
jgi:hypothetical protein